MYQPVLDADRGLSIDVATSVAMLERLRADYERLDRAAGNTSPFTLFDWHHTWCTHFLNLDPGVADQLSVMVVRNEQSECIAIVPLVASRRRIGPASIMSVELLGADPSTTESRTPLVVPGYEASVARAVRRQLERQRAWDWDWITWGGVADDFGRVLAAEDGVTVSPGAPGYVLDLPSGWEEFRAGLKRNIRESLRHCYNSLRRDGLLFAFEVAETPDQVRRGVERFLALHALRAGMTGTVEHPDHFAPEVSKRFLLAVCAKLAERRAVRILQLRIGDDIVATRIGFVVGDCLNLYYSGFDPAWARYGVMTTVLAESIKYAIEHQLRSVNLSRGTDISKTRWGPRQVPYASAVELRPRLVSRLAHRCYSSARSGSGLHTWLLRRLGKTRRNWG
jgi:CelD/BcsL family acetyltransferase involved in cellulose biosynthesis